MEGGAQWGKYISPFTVIEIFRHFGLMEEQSHDHHFFGRGNKIEKKNQNDRVRTLNNRPVRRNKN